MMKTRTLLAVLGLGVGVVAFAQDVPDAADAGIGYASPEAALEALRNRPGVALKEQNDWFVLTDTAASTVWSIATPRHPAHPTAVKRAFIQKDGAVFVKMDVQCGASKAVCDQVVQQFQSLNAGIQRSLDP